MTLADALEDGFLPVAEAATRMQLSVEQVRQLVSRRVLRATWDGLWVQPAIVSGAVDV